MKALKIFNYIAIFMCTMVTFSWGAASIGARNLETITLDETGHVVLYISGEGITTPCGANNKTFVLDKDSALYKEMFSSVLSALHTDKKVVLYYDGSCVSIRGGNYPKVTMIILTKS